MLYPLFHLQIFIVMHISKNSLNLKIKCVKRIMKNTHLISASL